MFSDNQLEDLKHRAIEVLKLNNHTHFTKPSSKLYPHQWNWDSAFIAIGLSHIDQERAQKEIYSLLNGQWTNGMLPHIIYSQNNNDYLPNLDFWESKNIENSPANISTSGITQPPVLTFAALNVYENSKDKYNAQKFLKDIYPKLLSYHRFLHEDRDLVGDGLICILHPWESGLDNSPRWDKILQNIQNKNLSRINRIDNKLIAKHQRPTDKDYELYFFIAEKLKAQDYQINNFLNLPFAVKDIMFNALAIVEEFIGHNIALFAAHYIAKPPLTGQAVLWHQDGTYWPLEPMEVISIWLAGTDSTAENGCMRVIPGTQNKKLLLQEELQEVSDGKNVLGSGIYLSQIDDTDAVDLELNAGDVSLHNPSIVHGSNPNTSDNWRIGLTIRYIPTSTFVKIEGHRSILLRGETDPKVKNNFADRPVFNPQIHMKFNGWEKWSLK